MAEGEPNIVTASCGGENGGTMPVTQAHSGVAGVEYTTASASLASSQWSEYVTAGMSEVQISAAIEQSREQGWTEPKDWSQYDTMASSSHAQDNLIVWEELKTLEVAKVFKLEAFSLADLKRQWPVTTKEDPEAAGNGRFVTGKVVFSGSGLLFCSKIRWGTLLNDGRFAFVMKRYWGDLRTLINLRLGDNNSEGPPFLTS